MQLEEQRGAIAGRQPVEEARLPQRPRAVEGRFVGGRDLAQQLVHVAGRRERVDAQVVVEVEGRIVLPVRQGEIERRVAHALCEPRHRIDGALEGDAQPAPRPARGRGPSASPWWSAGQANRATRRSDLHRTDAPADRSWLADPCAGVLRCVRYMRLPRSHPEKAACQRRALAGAGLLGRWFAHMGEDSAATISTLA